MSVTVNHKYDDSLLVVNETYMYRAVNVELPIATLASSRTSIILFPFISKSILL